MNLLKKKHLDLEHGFLLVSSCQAIAEDGNLLSIVWDDGSSSDVPVDYVRKLERVNAACHFEVAAAVGDFCRC